MTNRISAVPPAPRDARMLANPVTGPERCPYCAGKGAREPVGYAIGRPYLNTIETCPFCRGTGRKS